MTEAQNNKNYYNLEERTMRFAIAVRKFLRLLPKTISNIEDGKQVVRSSGSIGANYIEANEALSNKDFKHRVKISRKEAKETHYWLSIICENNDDKILKKCKILIQESLELKKILSSILEKCK
jgi:four helix bundle protein